MTNPDLVKLDGCREVRTSEPPASFALPAGQIKELTVPENFAESANFRGTCELIGLGSPYDIHHGQFRLTLQVRNAQGEFIPYRFLVPANLLHLLGLWISEIYADGFEGEDLSGAAR